MEVYTHAATPDEAPAPMFLCFSPREARQLRAATSAYRDRLSVMSGDRTAGLPVADSPLLTSLAAAARTWKGRDFALDCTIRGTGIPGVLAILGVASEAPGNWPPGYRNPEHTDLRLPADVRGAELLHMYAVEISADAS